MYKSNTTVGRHYINIIISTIVFDRKR